MDSSINNPTKKSNANDGAHKPGMSNNEVVNYYNEWAVNYDNDLDYNVYRGPEIASSMCNILLKDKNSCILDIGAGTGFVGYFLVKYGFKCVDGLEPAESMLKLAKSKNIYRKLYLEGIKANSQTSLPENSYDLCINSGAFGEGHIPVEGLREFIRLTKPNGYIVNVIRKEYLQKVKEYSDKLEPLMNKLEEEGLWRKITRFEIENYSFNNIGVVFVFRKI